MSDEERESWDRAYAEGRYTPRTEATPLLERWLSRIPAGRALDVATGTGRNALRMAEAGFSVDAVDISQVAIDLARAEAAARGLEVGWHVGDLDDGDLPGRDYDLIAVLRYRNPDLWPRLRAALAPNGWLIVEHHLRTHLDAGGPQQASFRLEPGELQAALPDLRVVHYDETVEPADIGEGIFVIARYVACAGDPGW